MALKDSIDKWVRSGPQAVAAIAAVTFVVGGVIGLGVGYKIEKSRTQSDVKRLQQQLKAGGGGGATGVLGQRLGKVTAISGSKITLRTTRGGTQTVTAASNVRVETVVKGTIADVVAGRHVIVLPGGAEVVVLPTASVLGRVVKTVRSDAFTVVSADGKKSAQVVLSKLKTVEKTSTATLAAVKVGASVLVGGRATGPTAFSGLEIVVFPKTSGFAR